MKKLANVVEVDGEGFESLLGEEVLIMCAAYFYAGTLEGVNDRYVKLSNAHKVYDTGPYRTAGYKELEDLGTDAYVLIGSIECFIKRELGKK